MIVMNLDILPKKLLSDASPHEFCAIFKTAFAIDSFLEYFIEQIKLWFMEIQFEE